MISAAQLAILEDAGTAVLTLAEGLNEEEFFATRLTREEVKRQLLHFAETAANISGDALALLPEIDWGGWQAIGRVLRSQPPATPEAVHDALWHGVRSLVPATMLWLRVYRQNQPEVFAFQPD
jgi:uncharacterized protein with HEPN domain